MSNEYFCTDCGVELGEKGSDPGKYPCPACGGGRRTGTLGTAYEYDMAMPLGVVVGPSYSESKPQQTIIQQQPLEEVATVPEFVKHVVLIGPTDQNGSWTCMVRNERDELVAMTEQRDIQDALLAIIEAVGPEED